MIIPQELKTPTRVNKYMYLYDFVFIISYFLFFSVLGSGIHEVLKIPYYAYNLGVAFILTRGSRSNPQKRIYEAILYRIIKDRSVYHPVVDTDQKEVIQGNV